MSIKKKKNDTVISSRKWRDDQGLRPDIKLSDHM